MITHLQFSNQSQGGSLLRQFLTATDTVLTVGDYLSRLFPTLIDGDGSNIAMFDGVVQWFGIGGWVAGQSVVDAQRTMAQSVWNEFNSAWSKVSGDSAVSSVNSALKQIGAKCR